MVFLGLRWSDLTQVCLFVTMHFLKLQWLVNFVLRSSLFLCTFLQRCAVYCICERKCPPKPAAAVQSGRNSVCVLEPDYVDTTCSMLFLSNIQQSSTLSQE